MKQRWMIVHKVVLQVVLPVLRILPYRLSHAFLSLMGRLDLLVIPKQAALYEKAVADVSARLGCEWDVRAVASRALARQTYRWRVRDLLLDRKDDAAVDALFRVTGRERLDTAIARGRGVILLANHYGSHVLMTHWMFRQGYDLRWLGERPRNISSYLRERFAARGALGQQDLFVSRRAGAAEGASAIYHAARILNAGLVLKVACDVRWGDAKSAPADFLGGTERFSTTWVTLAAMTGAAVVPTFCRMNEDGTFDLEFHEPSEIPREARRDDQAGGHVQAMLALLEAEVRRYPDQSNDYFFWEFANKRLPRPHARVSRTEAPEAATV